MKRKSSSDSRNHHCFIIKFYRKKSFCLVNGKQTKIHFSWFPKIDIKSWELRLTHLVVEQAAAEAFVGQAFVASSGVLVASCEEEDIDVLAFLGSKKLRDFS